jgi:CBS domain-containing protein
MARDRPVGYSRAVVSELHDVREFLAGRPPFVALPGAALDVLPRHISVRYLRRGASFPPADADPSGLYVLRKGAVEIRDAAGALVEKLAEGDIFDPTAVDSEDEPPRGGTASEDTLLYVIAGPGLADLRRAHPAFDRSFDRTIVERLRRAGEAAHDAPRTGGDLLHLRVRDLVSRQPVTAPPDLTVREAAQLMTRERVSSLLVEDSGVLKGIVTDRDLRSRCVAAGLHGDTPLREVMTASPLTVSRHASAFEALLTMSHRHIHHLPVVDGDELHGLVSTHDLLRAQATNPLYLADRVARCGSVEALRETVTEVRELHLQLVAAHATARQLGQAVTSVCDAVTRRLIDLAIDRLGPPPVPFAWVATGSQGRGELTLCSDQDNAIILDDAFSADAHGDYFSALSRSVNESLHQAGYVRCPGNVMASNPAWRQPVGAWKGYFRDWLQRTDHKTVTLAVNFFDMRTVWGEESLRQRLLATVLPETVRAKVFLAYLAGHALGNQPPLGFFRNFVVARSGAHEGMVDLKKRGLLPIVDLARVHSLTAGLDVVATQQRLREAAAHGSLTAEGAELLDSAFELVWTLRARSQAEQLRRNAPVNNFVAPETLTPMERRHLKDAFAAIATLQRALSAAHGDRLPL